MTTSYPHAFAVFRRVAIVSWLVLIAALFVYSVVLAPVEVRETAKRHSVQLWGEPLTGRLVSVSGMQPSKDGPYRVATFAFENKFGETQRIKGDFEPENVSKSIVVWQKASTAQTFLPGEYIHDQDSADAKTGPTLPYYSGNMTQIGWTVFGFFATVLTAFILWAWWVLICDDIKAGFERRSCKPEQIKATSA
jgi:hypothetical protein